MCASLLCRMSVRHLRIVYEAAGYRQLYVPAHADDIPHSFVYSLFRVGILDVT